MTTGQVQWRPTFIVGDIHVCPRTDEEPRDIE
jgi:hypothetical protein